MDVKLFDSELKIMGVVWRENGATAKRIAEVMKTEMDWSVSTTYTLIHRCIKKGALERLEPDFTCRALVTQEEVQDAETDELIDRVFNGSADKLFSALVSRKKVSPDEIAKLRALIDENLPAE